MTLCIDACLHSMHASSPTDMQSAYRSLLLVQDRAIAKQSAWSHVLSLGFTTVVAVEVGFYYSNFEQVHFPMQHIAPQSCKSAHVST